MTERPLTGATRLAVENERLRSDLRGLRLVARAQERENAGLEARCGALRAALLRLEWKPCHEDCTERFCPACGGWGNAPDDANVPAGHTSECFLAAALACSSEDAG